MIEYSREGILALTRELVRIPSVSHTPGENHAADFIHSLLAEEDYFRKNPDFLRVLSVEGGDGIDAGLGRRAVLAFVAAGAGEGRSAGAEGDAVGRYPSGLATARTVIFNGHFDVVDTDVYGELAEVAYDAEECTRRMAGRDIPAEAREDLESGNWLFGRGTMDMKAGLALHMAYLCRMARHRDELGVNLLFLAVPDEEGNSAGMRGALPGLCAFAREYGLDFAAAISGEPAFWTSRSENPDEGAEPYRIFFTGTTGKIMPMFFCVGREAHAGYSFDGVNAAALAAQTVCLMDCHPELIDGSGADTLTPPVCLKMKDLRESYSVTLPERAVTYFNILTVSRSPREILDICRGVAEKALHATLERIREAGRRFQSLSGRASSPVPAWEPRVFTVQEVMGRVEGLRADEVEAQLRTFLATLPSTLDEREKGIAVVDRLVSLANIKGPAIIVGFLPPYYPQRLNLRATEKERRLRAIMEDICGELSASVGNVKLVECFSGIMDLSFMGFQGEAGDLRVLSENMPGWGTLFSLPMDELLSLDVPIANMGPSGKDAHKDTERLELGYSLDVAPRMLEKLIARLSER